MRAYAYLAATLLLVLTGSPSRAAEYHVEIRAGERTGAQGWFYFELINANRAVDCVALSGIVTDSKIRDVYGEGGEHRGWQGLWKGFASPGGSVSICDSSGGILNGLWIGTDSLGAGIEFSFAFDSAGRGDSVLTDSFSLRFLDLRDEAPVIPTADPCRTHALFTLSFGGDGSEVMAVFEPMTLQTPNRLYLDLDTTGPAEPAASGLTVLDVEVRDPQQVVVRYHLARAAEIRIQVRDALGAPIRSLGGDARPPGVSEVVWDGRDATSQLVLPAGYLIEVVGAGATVLRPVRLD